MIFGVRSDVRWSLIELESRWQCPVMVWLESVFHTILMPGQLPCLSDVTGIHPRGLPTWEYLLPAYLHILTLGYSGNVQDDASFND